jgi:mannose-1-phosphate guanylyltransferase
MRNAPLFLALLAGGRGTRFWPLSRRARPKQLLDILGEGPMLARSLERVAALAPTARTLLVTSSDLARPSARLLGLPARNVLAEPEGRNTAAAVGLACLVAAARHPDAIVAALPSDHHVSSPARLRTLLLRAARAAAAFRAPVLIGVPALSASSQFGYVESGKSARLTGAPGLAEVAGFTEKPSPARAKALVARGAMWNSGMFVVHARATLEAMARCAPALGAALARLEKHLGRSTWRAALAREYGKLPSISFDHAVLERIQPVLCLRAPDGLGWSDVGTWESLASLLPADASGNCARGPAFAQDSRGCVLIGESGGSRTLVVAGADNLVVVDAGDVILVAPRAVAANPVALLAALAKERPELL